MDFLTHKPFAHTVLLFLLFVFPIGGLQSIASSKTLAHGLDPELQPYHSVRGEVAGALKHVGSDTMNNLVALWTEGFKKFYPSVREGIEGKGSSSCASSSYGRHWHFWPHESALEIA